jgi:hypothetical protein
VQGARKLAHDAFCSRYLQAGPDDEKKIGSATAGLRASNQVTPHGLTDTFSVHVYLVVQDNAWAKLADASGALALLQPNVVRCLTLGTRWQRASNERGDVLLNLVVILERLFTVQAMEGLEVAMKGDASGDFGCWTSAASLLELRHSEAETGLLLQTVDVLGIDSK